MEKLKMHSPDLARDNIEKLAALFPSCITESTDESGKPKKAIDFDLLRQELTSEIVEGPQERYHLNWPGKREALLTANMPIAKTLRPCREESLNFDSTENLFIEGDNLDALKLLQETYLGKVKMIYIDPPYNTGKDFIYKDNFKQSTDSYLQKSEQKDEEGNRLVANTDSNGRFHSDWLSMMYPRLKLARNLLRDDGVIFISIDDNEQANLKRMCDEVFGEENFIANIVWQKKTGSSDASHIAIITESVLVYSKQLIDLALNQNEDAHDENRFKYTDQYFEERGPFYYDNLDRGTLGYHETLDYGINAPDGKTVFPNGRIEQFNDGWRWKWGKEKLEWGLRNGFVEVLEAPSSDLGWKVYYKIYLKVDNEGNSIKRSSPYKNIIQGVLNTHASNEAKNLFGKTGLFSNPKPISLVNQLSRIGTNPGDIILDFFAGSATTAHAVMQLNAEDNGKRKFIMVQLPEVCDEASEAFKAGYKTIAEISKERIRRAGNKIKEKHAMTAPDLDIGFRVLKVDSSNMADVYYKPDNVTQDVLKGLTDNIKDDRRSEDLVFQVLLDWGVDLTLPITKETIDDREVFFVDGDALAACFEGDGKISEDFCKGLAGRKPMRVVFRDSGFKDDSVKINVEQIFNLMSPNTDIKTL